MSSLILAADTAIADRAQAERTALPAYILRCGLALGVLLALYAAAGL